MKRQIFRTGDGTLTLRLEDWDEQYHSKHGALQEAFHVFIKHGLHHLTTTTPYILEMGFGTGLNALVSYAEAKSHQLNINYTGVEAFPVKKEEWEALEYGTILPRNDLETVIGAIHDAPWEQKTPIADCFTLTKHQMDFFDFESSINFDLVYFDAFGPRVQPELWTVEIFAKMYKVLRAGGILVTYSAKGSVRRAMLEVGFKVERLPGPPGKREMLRATKPTL
ncbi:MAG: tRNA (5-methylaminomethyl-2-thiouridine)(34)-methyltransferase MnmD [Bacteroidota bacterium]